MVSGAIKSISDNLRSQPVVFAMVVVNALFLIAAVLVLREIGSNARARDQLLAQCVGKIQEQRNAR